MAIRYRRAAKLEDHLTVRTRIKTLRRASIVFEQNVYRGSELITEGEVRVGAVSRRTMAPAAMPESLYEKSARCSTLPTKFQFIHSDKAFHYEHHCRSFDPHAHRQRESGREGRSRYSDRAFACQLDGHLPEILRRAPRHASNRRFRVAFLSGTELTKLLDTANRSRDTSGMEERIFAAGMNEFMKQRQTAGAADTVNSVSRAMRAVFTREMDRLENGLPMLASIGSTSPYIGLFGTVWGHHERFHGALEP